MKKIIREKISKTKYDSFKRIYIDGKEILDTDFKIGSKFSYEIDFESKKVRIVPNDTECNGTVSKKKRRYKDKEEIIPVIDIHNKNIMKVFEGINKCKVTIYDDEILVEPLVEDNVADTLVSKVKKTCNNVIDIFTKKKPVKKIYRLPVSNLEYLIKCKAAGSFYEQISIDDFSFDLDVDLNSVVSATEQLERDKPILSDTLKVLSLFSGIGAFEEALKNVGANFELVNYCEFKPFISKSYSIVHNIKEKLNLGDVREVDETKLKDFDLLTFGFPCQDISALGKRQGFYNDDGTLTRSGMLIEALRIARYKKPKYMIIENVRKLTHEPFKKDFKTMLEVIDEMGYNTYWKILNSKDYSIPHSRHRVFVIAIRKDIDDHKFKFPDKEILTSIAPDYYEKNVDDEYYVGEDQYKYFGEDKLKKQYSGLNAKIAICMTTKQGTRSNPQNFVKDEKGYRMFTEGEMFALQGFNPKYGKLLRKCGITLGQIGYMLGNSITVTVVERILKKLLPKKYFSNVVPLF